MTRFKFILTSLIVAVSAVLTSLLLEYQNQAKFRENAALWRAAGQSTCRTDGGK